ncbi:mitochondrial large subunit ribosomal protein [Toxoplasma gondii RUB]|uniref:Large ribosomal subunit protein mL49 n=11 Tax=Toxoplasma gondii TaxID=5811 RepID=A0A125YLA8_TOXGV|nr:mitochondrial large subunit ribosomal protein [Toxoplasma gondii GT1]ESS36319.1 mitochondrial large subunit ribosomal protein [Toxoplasma gondii VEG]KAF4642443.1 mitochondrial large subunit ribosomal protein [Toxoplasma gondii]KFG39170.1 mitochondrial large subunit ribosomal protein [Toxoplasma gondii GAB2-2007-GAL-DOM2]KFG52507.1 mitochondrial large subunit ribosomal protein [Toxoplasma gondii p89]KFG54587.1 mitochondrial large subunit ribosomal protein [Toxoplasma gondii FOU]KFG61414.1 m
MQRLHQNFISFQVQATQQTRPRAMARITWTVGMLPGRPLAALSFPSKRGYSFWKTATTHTVANLSSAASTTQVSSGHATRELTSFSDQHPPNEPLLQTDQNPPSSRGCTPSKNQEVGKSREGEDNVGVSEAEFVSDDSLRSTGNTGFPYPPLDRPRRISAADSEAFRRRWKTANQLPFFIRRTASDNVPVYLHWSNNRNKVSTIIRKVHGRKQILKSELAVLCEAPVIEKEGWLEVRGNHKKVIKEWLKQIGY